MGFNQKPRRPETKQFHSPRIRDQKLNGARLLGEQCTAALPVNEPEAAAGLERRGLEDLDKQVKQRSRISARDPCFLLAHSGRILQDRNASGSQALIRGRFLALSRTGKPNSAVLSTDGAQPMLAQSWSGPRKRHCRKLGRLARMPLDFAIETIRYISDQWILLSQFPGNFPTKCS